MKIGKRNQTTLKHQDVFMKRKTQTPEWKTPQATPPLENSTKMNSCSIRTIINPPSLYRPKYLSTLCSS